MFESTKPSYWARLHERAWAKTKEILGFNVWTTLLTAAALALGGSIHAWLRTTQAAVERISIGLFYTAAFVVIGVVTYLVNIVRSAPAIHEEQQDEMKRLDDALNAYSKSAQLAETLVEFRKQGVRLRNRRLEKQSAPSLDGLVLAGWKDEVDAWEKKVLATIKGQVSAADYGRFETLNSYPPLHFALQINALHGQDLGMLSRRIDILLEIMGNF
jgi:hypothetical protein